MSKKVKEELFRKLYDQTYTGLRRFVQYRSRNLHMTDDILQEIYLELYRHIDELVVHQNQIGWIYKTAEFKIMKLNEVYDRNASRELGNPDFAEPLTDDNTEGTIQLDEYRTILKEDELALVMKRYIEGYSYKEIGQMTGNTEAGSKMKITRLITKLRKNIRDNVILMISSKLYYELSSGKAIQPRSDLGTCEICISTSEGRLVVVYSTSCRGVASKIGVRNMTLQQKKGLKWKDLVIRSEYSKDTDAYFGGFIVEEPEAGGKYRVTGTHYVVKNSIETSRYAETETYTIPKN